MEKKIFLSRCTKEFKKESRDLYDFFKIYPGIGVIEQETYVQIHDHKHTLESLYELIDEHDIFIQLIGNKAGSPVINDSKDSKDTLTPFLKSCGRYFDAKGAEITDLDRDDICRLLIENARPFSKISYTQWEIYIALHLEKPILCYDLRDNNQAQKSHVDLLTKAGIEVYKIDKDRRKDTLHLCGKIINALSQQHSESPENGKLKIKRNDPYLPACLDIRGSIDFVGRINDLKDLDNCLKQDDKKKKRIIQVIADGGTGKTKLIARWIHSRRMAALPGKTSQDIKLSKKELKFFQEGSVLAYSLYKQGTNRLTSGDSNDSGKAVVGSTIWQEAGNKWLKSDPDFKKIFKTSEKKSSGWKAKKLAETLREKSILLILDGLEAALSPAKIKGKPEWVAQDDFLNYFLEFISGYENSKCIVIITTRVKITITPSKYTDRMVNRDRMVIKNIAPLAFKPEEDEKNNDRDRNETIDSEDEAASVLYYYSERHENPAMELFSKSSSVEEKEEIKIIRDELLLSREVTIPDDIQENLHTIATKLRGHALSLKLAGQLVAFEIDNWDCIAHNLNLIRYQSPSPQGGNEFFKTVERVKYLLDSHILAFQEHDRPKLKALLAVGVFDREANFREIEHAANQLNKLNNCLLGPTTPDQLTNALNELTNNGFLNSDDDEDQSASEMKVWDCHPLIRSRLCTYIFDEDKDPQKARRCHHEVAIFFLKQLDFTRNKDILISLDKLNKAEQEDRDGRKSDWQCHHKKNAENAFNDMISLQRAVYHFILAGELRTAWHLYWEWMSVGKEYLFSRFFGEFEEDLSTLSYFFETPWSAIKEAEDEDQKISPADIASLFDAAGFRLRSLNRITEAHQASGGAFLYWHKVGWNSHEEISTDEKKVLRESSYAVGNRAEYSMVQASLSDALMYANLAVRLADESEDSAARFIHRVELAEILWHRGNLNQAVNQLRCINDKKCPHYIQFKKKRGDNRQKAELYCLYRYRYGKILASRGEIKEAQLMAKELEKDIKETKWLLNNGLWYLLNGYINLAKAKPEWIISPQFTFPPEIDDPLDILQKGKDQFDKARKEFESNRAGHHVLKARIGQALCNYELIGSRGINNTKGKLSNITRTAGERHLFRIDAEVAKAKLLNSEQQVAIAKSLCIKAGYLRHLPLLDSLSPKKE
ncbi:MAG: hypothetical protein QTN59_16695 [Candidatus Electrothrix communis]|nr:MAG: hypothetical protein QTN59_16695 [Candidatus Electrothrix communis]